MKSKTNRMHHLVQHFCEGIADNLGLNGPWTHCAYENFWKVSQLGPKGIEETLQTIVRHRN